jgi:hypothetical protein
MDIRFGTWNVRASIYRIRWKKTGAQNGDEGWALVKTEVNLRVP